MSMPTYEDIMLPFLEHLADGKCHMLKDLHYTLVKDFKLSDEERCRLLPSGKQTMFYNRIGWARTHLKKAMLIQTLSPGKYQISEKGKEVLQTGIRYIDSKYLLQFAEYQQFWKPAQQTNENQEINGVCEPKTPQELIDSCYRDIHNALADELLQQIMAQSPRFFEQVVLDLLLKMGYGGSREDAAQVVGKSGDGGIDGIIKEDRLGLDVIYIQAKRWKNSVGSPEIQTFLGALFAKNARKGIFITTSEFTAQARDLLLKVGNCAVVLIDGIELAQLMINYNVGVATETVYEVKRIDTDYFIEE